MNKFVKFDSRFRLNRIPTRYSVGDLSSIRDLFISQKDPSRSQLPILPPKTEIIEEKNTEGYIVELPVVLTLCLKDFVNQSLQHIQGRFQTNYDHTDPALGLYVDKRQSFMTELQNVLIEVIEQERRLGVYNLFWLAISKAIVQSIHETLLLIKSGEVSESPTLTNLAVPKTLGTYKIHLYHIFNDVLLETLKRVELHFQKEDDKKRESSPYFTGTKTLKLGASFNYEFSLAIIQAQAHMLIPDLKNIPTTTLLQQLLVEENERYHINYADFYKVYTILKNYVEQGIQNNNRTLIRALSAFLRVPTTAASEIPVDMILFEPIVISYLSDEIKKISYKSPTNNQKGLFRRRSETLQDLFGEDVWEMLLYDYLNLADDVRKSEVISFFRDRIAIVRSSKNFTTSKPRRIRVYEKPEPIEKITYNFTPGQKLISDLRNVTLLFLDLRGYTEVSAGNISSEALKQNLYRFFDPAMDIIDHFHGSIKFYAGDAIFASFGSGPWKDYHGLNAVRAAIEIQKIFKALKERGSMVFHGMGIGIHTGLVEDAYFFLNPVEKSTTVIGFTANLTGRLSSGKSERLNQKLDLQSVFTLNEYLMTRALSMHMDPATLAVFEEQLLKILDGIQEEKAKEEKSQALQPEFNVHVIKGVLNNNGIALSDTTFQYIREVVALKEVPSRTVVDYLYEDKAIGEIILFKKAGDASFKGLEGKFPIWGVYLRRWMK